MHAPRWTMMRFDQAWREGHAMTLEEAVRYALETCGIPGA
jgi:hypothetical protein